MTPTAASEPALAVASASVAAVVDRATLRPAARALVVTSSSLRPSLPKEPDVSEQIPIVTGPVLNIDLFGNDPDGLKG